MDHLLPPPFYKHLSKLQDQAKQVPFHKIKKVFEEETGMTLEESFAEFNPNAIAAASIAQVHEATLHDGRKVAVKIQKPHIKKQFWSDMAMHWLINWVIEKSFDLPVLHFVDDIERNLKKELDFEIEAENSKIGKRNFEKMSKWGVR